MYPRFVEQQIKEALGDTRVVLLTGPRQAGKTTPVQRLAGENMPFFTLGTLFHFSNTGLA